MPDFSSWVKKGDFIMRNLQKEVENFLKGFKTEDGQQFEIPIEGSLGLLAYGDLGLLAWRLKKKEYTKSIEHTKLKHA